MGAFRTVIGYNSLQFENGSTEPNRYLILDVQDDKNINGSAEIAKQPLQDGDTMSDHMYRNPVTINLAGAFGINGKNWNDDSYNFMEKGDRLTNIEEVFEFISNNGYLCTIVTIDEDDFMMDNKGRFTGSLKSNAKNRFKIRKNMALNSFQWTERQNTVKFSFGFSEVIMVEAQEYEELTEEEREALGLPKVTSPKGSSLGSMLVQTNALPQIIVQTLNDREYFQKEWLDMLYNSKDAIVGIAIATVIAFVVQGVAAVVGGITGAVLGAVAGSVTALFPVGTLIAAGVAVVACIGFGIFNLIKKARKKNKVFRLINGSAEQDGLRLKNLIDDIEITLNQLQTSITIFSISGNYEQQVILNLGGDYYVINFVKNNVSEDYYEWTATVEDMEGNPLDTVYHSWCPVNNYTDLNRNQNLWFKDKSKEYEVYLVNPSLSPDCNDTREKLIAAKQNLEGYTIWVSHGDIEPQVKAVMDAIGDAIKERGFD